MRETTLRIGAFMYALGAAAGCGSEPGGSTASTTTPTGATSPTEVTGVGSTGPTGGATDGTGTGTGGEPTTSGGSSGDSGVGPKLDVGSVDFGGRPGDKGCEKVDFLFVVDNSGSMEDEQQNLVNSFPGFIATIQGTLMAQDYHILVADTDAQSLGFNNITCINGVCTCKPEPQCCVGVCSGQIVDPPPPDCSGKPCSEWKPPEGCDAALGGGKLNDPIGVPCGVDSGERYMLASQQDLPGTFACVAKVGAGGDGNELPMAAMLEAVGPLNQAGQCNEGFLRPDAILVVTFITDEEDEKKSMGDPATWKQALVDLKGGDEQAVVVLGLVGDPDVPGGVCTDGAEASPRLRAFAESFPRGQWGSVCAPDYSPFFAEAVSVIDTACDEFTPPG